ncbi:MAG: hypothetical protein GY826_43005 [Fuerstiella sp.]|nr:hypothetical protein [Fuerstiella sp.]
MLAMANQQLVSFSTTNRTMSRTDERCLTGTTGCYGPNPSDADANAPTIYFHWIPWVPGAVVTQLLITPEAAYSLLTIVMLPILWRFDVATDQTSHNTASACHNGAGVMGRRYGIKITYHCIVAASW